MTEPLIQVKDFKKEFGSKLVLNRINLQVNKGEIFGVVGMSGSGKTTLLNSMIGFISPEEGDILFKLDNEFKSIYQHPMEVNKVFGFASQQASVYPKLTVEENLDHFGSLYDLPSKTKKANIINLLKMTGLEDSKDRLAKNLSGGMQKRLSIACALIHDPKVLILDEPTSDLDPILRKQAWELIQRINENGTTIIVASHFLRELEHVCHNLAVIHNSQIITNGTPDELRDNYSKNYEISLETLEAQYDDIIHRMKITDFKIKGHKLIINTPVPEKVLIHLLPILEHSKATLLDLDVNRPNLSEVFESLTKNVKNS